MKPMRVIVTGSRDWADRTAVWGALDHIAEAARTIGAKLIVAHGCAEGADQLADEVPQPPPAGLAGRGAEVPRGLA